MAPKHGPDQPPLNDGVAEWRRAMAAGALVSLPDWSSPLDDAQMFDLAPVSLWLEDYSELKQLYERWRAEGLTDLRQFLLEDPQQIGLCFSKLRVLKVNRETLRLFSCPDLTTLNRNLQSIFPLYANSPHIEQLTQMWSGEPTFCFRSVDRSLSGQPIDVCVHGVILPGHEHDWARVLVAVEDVSIQENARRDLVVSERYAHSLFEYSPAALLVQDASKIRLLLSEARAAGVADLRRHLAQNRDFALQCLRAIRIIDANQMALTLFEAPDRATLIERLPEIMREDMLPHFTDELVSFWEGDLTLRREAVNYALSGAALNVLLQVSVLPGHEDDWARVLVVVTDITARKKAERHLEFLSRHDILTGLHNRAAFIEHLRRFDREGPFPVAVIIADLDGLKAANDQFGHAFGDDLLRRGGRVLSMATERPCCAARIGGDEFVLVVPAAGEPEAAAIVARIRALAARGNLEAPDNPLRLSLGFAICHGPNHLDATVRDADLRMYEAKRASYAAARLPERRVRESCKSSTNIEKN